LGVQRWSLKTKKSSVWQRLSVWFLSVAFLVPHVWGLFQNNPLGLLPDAQFTANLALSLDEAHRQSFPMDEQQYGFGELEIVVEAGTEGFDENSSRAHPHPVDFEITFIGGLFGLGLWSRIGEKNLSVPLALYLRHHALRIPS
jgi:hypothetical protein